MMISVRITTDKCSSNRGAVQDQSGIDRATEAAELQTNPNYKQDTTFVFTTGQVVIRRQIYLAVAAARK